MEGEDDLGDRLAEDHRLVRVFEAFCFCLSLIAHTAIDNSPAVTSMSTHSSFICVPTFFCASVKKTQVLEDQRERVLARRRGVSAEAPPCGHALPLVGSQQFVITLVLGDEGIRIFHPFILALCIYLVDKGSTAQVRELCDSFSLGDFVIERRSLEFTVIDQVTPAELGA